MFLHWIGDLQSDQQSEDKMKLITNRLRKIGITVSTALLGACLTLTAVLPAFQEEEASLSAEASANQSVTKIDSGNIDSNITDYYSAATTEALSSSVGDDEEISVIVCLNEDSVLDAYATDKKASGKTVAEYALSKEGAVVAANIRTQQIKLQSLLSRSGVQYTLGNTYDTLIGGFEIIIKAKYFDLVCDTLDGKATPIVGDVYSESVVESDGGSDGVVTNTVNVYDTGIFDSSNSKYSGSGVVIAVLDTGLDYTHTAFDVSRFEGDEVVTLSDLSSKVSNLTAATMTAGLTAEDVYINKKIPYAYDYADGDSDVFPINSEHGTHVSGIIVGNDDEIKGVSPNAQLAFMKVFSDEATGARTSWILAALEDCVTLGVDIINMSLGTSAGYSREVDKVNIQTVYDKISEQGISVVAAAGNDYSSTYGSEKNGNLGLTSNPDNSAVSSPSSYTYSLSVASISGVETPYLISSATGSEPIYITEASATGITNKKFVDDVLALDEFAGKTSVTLEYVVIKGVGRNSDYSTVGDVTGKVVLVKRGSTNFEDKTRIAKENGAAACIIYNNVSGDISMSVGAVGNYPVCSISQDDGEALVAAGSGTITISSENTAGPFMSNFSSWGPGANLSIKPEITAHGGEIYSAVPGQSYDRLSGTSMATPNQVGVTALVYQYVQEEFAGENLTVRETTELVYRIMMSTADIVYNKNGLAYAVRKQGAGLVNLDEATSTPAYLQTYDKDGELMDKAKLELGDDPTKSGVYTMTFDIVNVKSEKLTYDVDAIVMTEGVSDTLTAKGLTVVTEEGYLLDGATVSVSSVSGGTVNGTKVTVEGNETAKITVKITLSDSDKAYLDKSFENGMYVEGFITLKAEDGTEVDLNVPYLAFYGDWTQAPLFDLDYFVTNKDELDDSLDTLDKTLPDAYATRPLGRTYLDYIVYLGAYAFAQDPSATKIAADRKYIALSNQDTGESGSTVNGIYAIYAGLLRGAKTMYVTIEDSTTGELIFSKTVTNQRKSYSSGTSIYPSSVDIDFNMSDYDLKNNTTYIFKMTGLLDYGDGGLTTNKNNTFEFPFVVDFQAPVLQDVQFRTEYVKDTKSYRVYADLYVYDNHYSQGALIGFVAHNTDPTSSYAYTLNSFGRYVTPIYSDYNSTSIVSYELTDYIEEIKNTSYNGNSFIVQLYDYAQNIGTYEVSIPDNIMGISFAQNGEEILEYTLKINETVALTDLVDISPANCWIGTLNYNSSDEKIARVVNGKLLGVSAGTTTITASSNSDSSVTATLNVTVVDEGNYSKPVADSFTLTGYIVNKVFAFASSSDRDLGTNDVGTTIWFTGSSYALSMYPSESVTLLYDLQAYFPEDTEIQFVSSNEKIVTVDEDGTIVAQAEGFASISVRVLQDGKSTYYSQSVSIEVKNPYTYNSIYLMSYMGLGGEVTIPDDLGITTIYQYAFSNFEYIPKDENDEISEEDPYNSKITYIGENTITKVIIPEGVEEIGAYAFAGLTALEEVVLPSTLTKIQYGAFINCTSLTTISFSSVNNLQFINNDAFSGCTSLNNISLTSIIAIGNRAFMNTKVARIVLPETAQSIGEQAFYNCTSLSRLSFNAEKVKLGAEAFAYCTQLSSVSVNASVIPAGVFYGCGNLASVTLGKDVSVIGQSAFADTKVSSFTIDAGNAYFKTGTSNMIVSNDGTLILASPTATTFWDASVTDVGEGAFAGNADLVTVYLPNVTKVGDYTFANCTSLTNVTLGVLTEIGDYAFFNTAITKLPSFSSELSEIGDYAFSGTQIKTAVIPDSVTVGVGAFFITPYLTTLQIGNNVVINDYAFAANGAYMLITEFGSNYYIGAAVYYSSLTDLKIGDNVTIGRNAFAGHTSLTSLQLGGNVTVGDYAFYDCTALTSADLSGVVSIGDYAFSGSRWLFYYGSDGSYVQQSYGSYTYFDEYVTAYWSSLAEIGYHPYTFVGGIGYSKLTGSSASFTELAGLSLTSLNLSSCVKLGESAFAFRQIPVVELSDQLTSVGTAAFYFNYALNSIDLGGVQELGDYALAYTSLTQFDASAITVVGEGAFYESLLEEVTLSSAGAEIGAYAFYNAPLYAAKNLDKATTVGAYAFANTLLTQATLTSAEQIGSFAFAGTPVTKVTLGDCLVTLGENPFVGCEIPEFTQNGENNYDVSDTVKVIDGVLYRVAQNGGYELITYPLGKTDTVFTIASGTIRVGAQAFYGSKIVSVEFPRSVAAIGDKAFYNCEKLSIVVFNGVTAPILEEQYDEDYQTIGNLPQTGIYGHYTEEDYQSNFTDYFETYEDFVAYFGGLGIVPYYMWSSSAVNYFYGANFVGYIGQDALTDQTLVMIRPNNGSYYETFIYLQYFNSVVDGMTAPTEATFAVIELIKALPTTFTSPLVNLAEFEAQAALVAAARNAYDALSTDQQALVYLGIDDDTNYLSALTSAETLVEYWRGQLNGGDVIDPTPEPTESNSATGLYVAIGILAGVIVVLVAAMVVIKIVNNKKNKSAEGGEQEDGDLNGGSSDGNNDAE